MPGIRIDEIARKIGVEEARVKRAAKELGLTPADQKGPRWFFYAESDIPAITEHCGKSAPSKPEPEPDDDGSVGSKLVQQAESGACASVKAASIDELGDDPWGVLARLGECSCDLVLPDRTITHAELRAAAWLNQQLEAVGV